MCFPYFYLTDSETPRPLRFGKTQSKSPPPFSDSIGRAKPLDGAQP
jgi:hypothetical protein